MQPTANTINNEILKQIVNWCRNFAVGKNHLTVNNVRSLCGVRLSNNAIFPPTEATQISDVNTCNDCLKRFSLEWKKILEEKEEYERRMSQVTGNESYRLK